MTIANVVKTADQNPTRFTNPLYSFVSNIHSFFPIPAKPPNGAHQPPASCARLRGGRVTTASLLHRWPDTTDGKSTPPRDATQAPGYLERGAAACAPAAQRSGVAGRLHARVGRRPSSMQGRWNRLLLQRPCYHYLPSYYWQIHPSDFSHYSPCREVARSGRDFIGINIYCTGGFFYPLVAIPIIKS